MWWGSAVDPWCSPQSCRIPPTSPRSPGRICSLWLVRFYICVCHEVRSFFLVWRGNRPFCWFWLLLWRGGRFACFMRPKNTGAQKYSQVSSGKESNISIHNTEMKYYIISANNFLQNLFVCEATLQSLYDTVSQCVQVSKRLWKEEAILM